MPGAQETAKCSALRSGPRPIDVSAGHVKKLPEAALLSTHWFNAALLCRPL
jgi:hypothetical protein